MQDVEWASSTLQLARREGVGSWRQACNLTSLQSARGIGGRSTQHASVC